MSKKVRVLLKKLILFLGLLALGYLSDGLPDAIWSFVIQSGLYGSALFVGIKLLMDGEEQRKEIETIKKTDLNEPRLIKRQIIQLKILLNFMRNFRKFIHFKMEKEICSNFLGNNDDFYINHWMWREESKGRICHCRR